MSIPYESMDFGAVIIKYTYKPGEKLPEVGDVMKDERATMVVTERCPEKNYIKVMLTATESVAERMERYKQEVDEQIEQIAAVLYERTTDGMVSLIGWDNLAEDIRQPYVDLAKEVVGKLDEAGLLILKYEDILV